MSERLRNLKLALAGGVVITSAAVLGSSADCGGDNKEPNTPTTVARTHTPEMPTMVSTVEATTTPIPEIPLAEMSRDNYLSVFESDKFSYREVDVHREPTDDPGDFIRTYDVLKEGIERHGVTVEKVDKDSGSVVSEIKSFPAFMNEVGSIKTKQEALGVLFLLDQDTKGYFGTILPDSDSSSEYIGAVALRGKECLLAKYQVDRDSGNYIRIASEVGQIAEGECE